MPQISWNWAKRRRAVALGAVLALGICGGIGIGVTVSPSSTTVVRVPVTVQPAAQSVSYLFAQGNSGGTLTGPNDNDLTLTVHGLRTYLTEFTDRPTREAVVIADTDFYREWNTWFKSSPPNAVLSWNPPGANLPSGIILELSDPRYFPATHTATYHAIKIVKTTNEFPGATVHVSVSKSAPNLSGNISSFGTSALFIDDGDPGEGAE